MFSRTKVGTHCINRLSYLSKYANRDKIVCRHVNTNVFPHEPKRRLGYVFGGGGCLILGICLTNKFSHSEHSWAKSLKPSSVLAGVNLRNQVNNIADMLEDKTLGIVAIDSWLTEDNNRRLYDYGIGFVEQSSELVITNTDFIRFDQDKLFQVIFEDGTAYYARVVSLDNHSDLAALRLCDEQGAVREKGGIPTVKLRKYPLRLGEKLVALTMHDRDSDPSVYKIYSGILTSVKHKEDDSPLQMSTNAVDGALGGPVLNLDGEVVGVISVRNHSGAALSIPYNYVRKFVERSLKHEKIIFEKEAEFRRKLREEKEKEEERLRKEMEEVIEARKQLEREPQKE